ncbi:MAG TPA: tyrosine--tRNA ligase, partial [Dehalococcoidia bacterium]|nr:tyrosine--tRNA ligase [Dehalococcoidia bacterium]
KPRIPTDEELRRITTRAVAEIVPQREFVDGLLSGRSLRLKMGFDPTKPVITLGWAVGLRKLRQLQDLGHTVVVIIGDWTARIGDPSGQSQTRAMLTAEEVQANSEAILRQFYKVLDESRTEIRRQSEWFDGFTLTDVVRLAARVTVAQILERDDFAQRFAAHKPVGLHELLYPLLQAYDSVAIEADVEFGGTDQKFNILLGRELQRAAGQKAGPAGEGQAVLLVPLLVGLDGTQKMSQSLGNYIAIDDPPHEMYGKLMSIPDTLIMDYFQLLTNVPDGELADIRKIVSAGGLGARDAKDRLAQTVVEWLHGQAAAQEAEEDFFSKFRTRVPPDVAFLVDVGPEGATPVEVSLSSSRLHSLPHLIQQAGLASSVREARILIEQGAVEKFGQMLGNEAKAISRRPGERITQFKIALSDGDIIRVGKHRFLHIVDADKRP